MPAARRGRIASAIAAAAVLLSTELLAVTHAAEFCDLEHSHDGTPCPIQLLSASAPLPPAEPKIVVRDRLTLVHRSCADFPSPLISPFSHDRAIRGPPAFSP